MTKHVDSGSLIIAGITLVLFVAALFAKGLGRDLFLEAGVFLVSVKIMVMAYKNSVAVSHLDEKLDLILREIAQRGGKRGEIAAGSKDSVGESNLPGN